MPQAQGQKIATFGLTEPAAGSDVRGIQTVAVKQGDRYVLTGEKMWISLADVADHFLVVRLDAISRRRSSAIRRASARSSSSARSRGSRAAR